jgi:hypothetical protein
MLTMENGTGLAARSCPLDRAWHRVEGLKATADCREAGTRHSVKWQSGVSWQRVSGRMVTKTAFRV